MSTEQQEREALVTELINVAGRTAVLHAEYIGKAMPEGVYDIFTMLRDERLPELKRKLLEALSAQPVVQGWQFVPVEPTPEMIEAGAIAHEHSSSDDLIGPMEDAYAAMLSAAPLVAQQAPELDPLTLCDCGDQFTKECPGTCVNCLAAMPKVRDEQAPEQEPAEQPVAWVRFCSDGFYEGPIMHAQIEDVRKRSGAWTPLYLHPEQDAKDAALTRDELARLLPGVYYMDPPDGGDVTPMEQLKRMSQDAARYRWLKNNPEWLGWEHDFRPDEVEREIDAAMSAIKAGGVK